MGTFFKEDFKESRHFKKKYRTNEKNCENINKQQQQQHQQQQRQKPRRSSDSAAGKVRTKAGTEAGTKPGTMGDFLRKKLEFLFRYRYDVNSDGMINFEDYESVVKKLTSAAAVQPGDKFYDDTDARQQQTFSFLMEAADKDGDGAISMGEFIEWGMNIGKQ